MVQFSYIIEIIILFLVDQIYFYAIILNIQMFGFVLLFVIKLYLYIYTIISNKLEQSSDMYLFKHSSYTCFKFIVNRIASS